MTIFALNCHVVTLLAFKKTNTAYDLELLLSNQLELFRNHKSPLEKYKFILNIFLFLFISMPLIFRSLNLKQSNLILQKGINISAFVASNDRFLPMSSSNEKQQLFLCWCYNFYVFHCFISHLFYIR